MNTIYGIRAVGNEAVIYIGYSTNFHKRKQNHKSDCLNPTSDRLHLPIYKHIRENGGFDKYEFVVLEESKDNIKFKEREYTDKYGLDNLLNVAGGNTGLSREEYKKLYRDNSKNKINEKFNCCCGGRYTRANKAEHFRSKKHISYINNFKTT